MVMKKKKEKNRDNKFPFNNYFPPIDEIEKNNKNFAVTRLRRRVDPF